MEPAKPPLPTPWNLPFQLEAGIQTSNWISESDDGLMTPATRQKAGRLDRALPAGGVKLPAGTDCARGMEVAGRSSLFRVSQVCAGCAADGSPGKPPRCRSAAGLELAAGCRGTRP